MSEPNSAESRIEIQTDEDWKERVKAEDARLDAERAGSTANVRRGSPEPAGDADQRSDERTGRPAVEGVHGSGDPSTTGSTGSGDPSTTGSPAYSADEAAADLDAAHLPPAEFSMLVQMFSTQAMVALGLLPEPDSGKAQRRPNLARHFIDLLGVLEGKTRGNLSSDEEKLLGATLHYLRMAFVEATRPST
jgi:hypothetical protein